MPVDVSAAPVDPAAISFDLPCCNCGYNLRSLPRDANCPECGQPIRLTMTPATPFCPPSQVRWARAVVLGLLLILVGSAASISIALIMPFSHEFGGGAARVNYLGPKVWAVPLLQRAIGYSPSPWGVNGVTAGLLIAAGIVLVTTAPTERDWREPITSLRFWTRWMPLLLFGGFLGLTLGCEGVPDDDPQVRKFVLAAIAGVEMPGTVLLYGLLWSVSRSLGLRGPARTFAAASVLAPLVFIGAGLMVVLGDELKWERNRFALQLAVSAYMAVSLCVSAAVLAAFVRVIGELLPIARRRINPVFLPEGPQVRES